MANDGRWLTPQELQAWLAYVSASALLESHLDRQLQRDAGMPHAYYQILAMLSEIPDRTLRMSDLAALTQSSQSRLSHAASRLEQRGYISRVRCPHDRRSTLARLTDDGYAALVAAAPGHVAAVQQHLFDRLTPEQVDQLRGICAAVVGGFDDAGPTPYSTVGPESQPE